MPLYTYLCPKCQREYSFWHSMKEEPRFVCDHCIPPVGLDKRLESSLLKYHGPGFYNRKGFSTK